MEKDLGSCKSLSSWLVKLSGMELPLLLASVGAAQELFLAHHTHSLAHLRLAVSVYMECSLATQLQQKGVAPR